MSFTFPPSRRMQPCCLCSQRHFQLLGERDRRGAPLRSVICTTCGLISHEEIPAESELAEFYQQDYRKTYQGEYSPRPHRVIRAWNLGGELVEKLHPFMRQGERVFEVGAGIGCTVKQFELAGYVAGGVEPHSGFREFGLRNLHANITAGVLDEMPQQPRYDMILMHHVLEHLSQPLEALEQVRRMLRLGGRAYVEVPNLAAPHAAPGKLFHYAHVYNFTPATLIALVTAAGFAVKHCFTQPGEETIGLLITPNAHAATRVDYTANYRQTLAAFTRLNSWTYYARPQYVWHRAARWGKQWLDRVQAAQRLQAILTRCQMPEKEVVRLARVA